MSWWPWSNTNHVDPMEYGVEEYAKRFKKLHPVLIDRMQPFFPNLDLQIVKVTVSSLWYTSLSMGYKNTPVYVWMGTVKCRTGWLNRKHTPVPVTTPGSGPFNFDLSTVYGFARMAHELYHVYQYHNEGWRAMLTHYWDALKRAMSAEQAWHDAPFEQAAGVFASLVRQNVDSAQLLIFKELR